MDNKPLKRKLLIFPTPEMIEWYERNTQHMEGWDELDSDVEMDKIRNDFFDEFQEDLEDADALDVWYKLM